MLHLRTCHRLALVIALLAGCQAGPPPTPTATGPAQPADALASALRSQGKLVEAANAYLRLSVTAPPPKADEYRLEAIAALLEANELARAKALLLQPLSDSASRDLALRYALLRATMALAEQRPEEVLAILPGGFALEDAPQYATAALQLRAQAYLQLKQYLNAASERVRLELVLEDSGAMAANRQQLWQTLARLNPVTLSQYATTPPATLDGWIELAMLSRQALVDPGGLMMAVDGWRTRYPGHPASEQIVPELLALSQAQNLAQPRQLALLLPFEGTFAGAAEAIRDGFITAWFADLSPLRPALIVRSTASASIPTLYREVINEGADYVVGPLDKPSVAALSHFPDITVPTLALNYAPPPAQTPLPIASPRPPAGQQAVPLLYQFALAPEAEAEQVAGQAWREGHRNAALLYPEGSWGERVSKAFSEAWAQLGGQITATRVYPSDAQSMASAVRQLLDLDRSEQRYQLLKTTLQRRLKHTVRRRQDIDFIFMAAFPVEARQLRPLLRFYHAAELPVYATSHVYSGVEDARADADIDGVIFADMPWVLAPEGQVAELHRQLRELWTEPLSQYGRLYAFGFDAYHLIPYLRLLAGQPFVELPGLTGRLVMDGEQRIERRLLWAQFTNGVPRLRSRADQASRP